MPTIPGTVLGAKISPGNTSVSFPTHDALYGKGGQREVADLTELAAIPAARLTTGCTAWVEGELTFYQWDGAAWNVLTLGGGPATQITETSGPTDLAIAAIPDNSLLARSGTTVVGRALDTDGTLAANSDTTIATQKAVKTYVDGIIAAQDAMVFKGVTDCSANPNYPAANRGDTYRVSVAGKIGGASGTNVEAGDIFICLDDSTSAGTQAAQGTHWGIIQTNIDGAVVGPASATDSHFAQFDGTTGKLIKGGLALDTDGTLAANSDTKVPSQKSVKTYVDAEASARASADAGKQPLDATLTALAATLTAANKIPYATAADTASELTLDTDGTLAANSDTTLASQKAVKTYVDAEASARASADAGKQPLDATLTALAGLATGANKIPYSTGTDTFGQLSLDTDGTLAANSDATLASQKAVKTYVDGIIAAQDAMVFKGVTDCSANPNYPAANRGDTYRVSVAGKIGGASGTNVEAGDIFICLDDSTSAGTQAAQGTHWGIIQTNIDGAVVGPASATDSHFAQFDGTTGKLIKGGLALDTDGTLAANSDTKVPSQKAVKTYADTKQTLDATLTALAGLATGANKIPYSTGTDTFGQLSLDTDGTLAANSDTSLASQKAVKTYVDAHSNNGGIAWAIITAAQAAVKGNGYICNHASTRIVVTLPTTSAVGDFFAVLGMGAAGWSIAQNASQSIVINSTLTTTVGTSGGMASAANYRTGVGLVCIVANTTWQLVSYSVDPNTAVVAGSFGYIACGFNPSNVRCSDTDRYNLTADTCALNAAAWGNAFSYATSVSCAAAGYVPGYDTGASRDIIEKLDYTTEVRTTLGTVMPSIIASNPAGVYSSTDGYTMGGWISARTTKIYKLNFSAETTSTPSGTLDTAKYSLTGVHSTTKGYTLGGFVAAGSTAVIEDLTFSTDASVALAATLDTAKRNNGNNGVGNTSKGYIMGGASNTAVIENMVYSGETSAAISATLDTAQNENCGFTGGLKGYVAGGAAVTTVTIENLTYSGETSVAEIATLSHGREAATGLSL